MSTVTLIITLVTTSQDSLSRLGCQAFFGGSASEGLGFRVWVLWVFLGLSLPVVSWNLTLVKNNPHSILHMS